MDKNSIVTIMKPQNVLIIVLYIKDEILSTSNRIPTRGQ